jgi:HlyD family secretion protein
MKYKRVLRVIVPLGVLAAILVWFVASRINRNKASAALKLYGNVDIRQVELGFRVAGRVVSMRFEEGQAVAPGVVLGQLDARPYEDEVRAAEAQVAQEAAVLEKLEHGPRAAEITEARGVLTEGNARLENAQINVDRNKRLLAMDAIPQATLDDAQADLDAAQARVKSAAAALRLLEEGSRVEDIDAARAALGTARARLASAQTALSDTLLNAPADGVILSRVVEPGAIVGPNDVVYVLSLTRPVWARAYISEPELGRIHPGTEVIVFSDSAPRRPHHGHVGFISPVAEFTPKSVETPDLRTALVYRLRVIIDDPDETLRQGMPVTVEVPLRPPTS